MKTLTNSSALFKPSSISSRGNNATKSSRAHFITEQKPKKTLHLSIRKVKQNIKYPHNDSKTLASTVHNPIQTSPTQYETSYSTNVHFKVYEIAIDAFFTFLKNALNAHLYSSIKQAFYNEISKATDLCKKYTSSTNQSLTLYTHKHTSSIGKALTHVNINIVDSNCVYASSHNSNKKNNLKLSYDLYSSNNIRKKTAKVVSKSNNNINACDVNSKCTRSGSNKSEKNKKEMKQHSLFTLTKHKMFLHNQTQSNSKSHSKEHKGKQSEYPLNIKLYNKLNRDKAKANYIQHHNTNNNIDDGITTKHEGSSKKQSKQSLHTLDISKTKKNLSLTNGTVVPNINIKLSHNKHANVNMMYNSNYFNSSSLNHNNNNTNLTTSTNTNRQHKTSVHKQKRVNKKKNKHAPTVVAVQNGMNKKMRMHPECKSCRERKSIQIGSDNNMQVLNVNEKQNSEQLREIKSNLDEDLKVMFNFSYEGFLNKDSESQSKISEGSGLSMEGKNKKDIKVNGDNVYKKEMIYRRKYDY